MAPLALYIHWPFCLAKCPYCDFNSHVRERIPEARFRAALLAELAFEAARLGPRPLGSIFFGGGTPSLMAPETVSALIDAATRLFPPLAPLEITLEANPTSVEREKLAAIRQAGVNRLSLGVQSLDDAALAFLGRKHSASEARAALAAAREIFPRVSFDLIYARPDQALASWRAELAEALAFGCDHLSLYQLTIEPGTAFATLHRRGEIVLPAAEAQAALYEATARRSGAARAFGLRNLELREAGRGKPPQPRLLALRGLRGHRARRARAHHARRVAHRHAPPSRAGSVGRARRTIRPRNHAEETLDPQARAREMLLMGLRLAEGIDPTRFFARTGMKLADALEPEALEHSFAAGYLAWSNEKLAATEEGRLRLDSLLPALVR